jgi:hypothetical protein
MSQNALNSFDFIIKARSGGDARKRREGDRDATLLDHFPCIVARNDQFGGDL